MSDLQRLDHGVLSIPNRTKNINRDLDRYKAEKAKRDQRNREDKIFLAKEREAARKPIREQAEALYKQHGKMLRAQLKGKTYGTGCTPAQILKQEIAVNPERFIKMVNKMLSEVQSD